MTIKVKLLQGRAGVNFAQVAGDVIEVDEAEAGRMHQVGLCAFVDEKDKDGCYAASGTFVQLFDHSAKNVDVEEDDEDDSDSINGDGTEQPAAGEGATTALGKAKAKSAKAKAKAEEAK